MKKVLFISPTPTHSTNAGNRAHIKSLVAFFKDHYFDVHFLYLGYENYSQEEMNNYFENDKLTVITKELLYLNRKNPAYFGRKFSRLFSHYKRKLQFYRNNISKDQFLYNSEVDYYFPPYAKKVIGQLKTKHSFDIVVCEYASMSKALTLFNKNVFKILDTHDVFTDRYKVYLDNHLKPEWISLYKDEESKALARAHLVLAVKEKDQLFFSNCCNRDIAMFNAIPEIIKLPARAFEQKLLYVASGNDINKATISYFINDVFPEILLVYPDARLLIGGSICEQISVENPNIILSGVVTNMKDFYSSGDIVINPETSGTGYKVKSLEALAYGMPLVSTRNGATGAIHPFSHHFFIAEDINDFAPLIIKIFGNPAQLNGVAQKAHEWVAQYKKSIEKNITGKLNLSHVLKQKDAVS